VTGEKIAVFGLFEILACSFRTALRLVFAVADVFLFLYPRMWTALKLKITWPPAVGRPKLSIGRKRENSSI
jgi:hypothetical protein